MTCMSADGEKIYPGRWRIVSMEYWDADYFDMEVAAHITIEDDLSGEFQFGCVLGQMNGRLSPRTAAYPVSGRGWLRADGNCAEGCIEFDLGERSKLVARRDNGCSKI